MSEHSKITERQWQRRAVVYVRESTAGQVERNTKSAARQYALADSAVELGSPATSVLVVDEDSRAAGRTPGSGFSNSRPRLASGTSA